MMMSFALKVLETEQMESVHQAISSGSF